MTSAEFEDCFENESSFFNKKYLNLNKQLFEIIENYNMVQYTTNDVNDPDSVHNIQMLIDNLVQYDEHKMPKDTYFQDNQEISEAF